MKLCIFSDYSAFNNTLTQNQIDTYVAALVTAIPDCQYIAIGTYLDYPDQFTKWATSIHNAGKKVWFRTSGYNFWQGKNGASVDNTLTALSNHRSQIQTFIATNFAIFQSGDIWSCPPDEPENWDGWDANYTSSALQPWKDAYNAFIQGCITDCNTAFSLAGVTGVVTSYVATNPNMSLNIVNTTTAAMLTGMNIDSYFDGDGGSTYPFRAQVDPHLAAAGIRYGIARYVVPSQGGSKPYHYTFGVNKWINLTDAQQAASFEDELFSIVRTIPVLDGITVFPMGRTTNPGSALFTYSAGVWTARPATAILNGYFKLLANSVIPIRKPIF